MAAHSRDLDRDSVGEFDMIVSEIFGSDALSEGVLPSLAHAQAELLAPGGTCVPAAVVIRAALASSGAMSSLLRDGTGDADADAPLRERVLRAFAVLVPPHASCHLPDVPGAALLTDGAAFVLDLCARPLATRGSLRCGVTASLDGVADAVLAWFEVRFDGGAACATGPADGRKLHWPQTLFRLRQPRRVARGESVTLQMDYVADRTGFSIL